MSTYAIIIERADDGGYGSWSPDVPGCVALGDTEAEALSEMKEAIRLHLEVLREREEPIPESATVSATTIDAALGSGLNQVSWFGRAWGAGCSFSRRRIRSG